MNMFNELHSSAGLTAPLGDYDLSRELGRGGTAVVYLGLERATGRTVAVKVIRAKHLADEETLARCAREARLAASLRHPNIVRLTAVRDLGDGGMALIMDYVPGRTLKQHLQIEGPLSPAEVEQVLRDVAAALGHAHGRGIVHRDVKPENIFLEHVPGDAIWRRALLSDFGIARSIDDAGASLTMTGVAIGTPSYMAPEQIEGGHVDARSDLYSLGLVAWEMRSGRTPWDGESLFAVLLHQKDDLPSPPFADLCPPGSARLVLAVEGLLAKAPEQRWRDSGQLVAALDGAPPPRQGSADAAGSGSETIRFLRPAPALAAAPALDHGRDLVMERVRPTRAPPADAQVADTTPASDAPPAAPRRRWTGWAGMLGGTALAALLAGSVVLGKVALRGSPFGQRASGVAMPGKAAPSAKPPVQMAAGALAAPIRPDRAPGPVVSSPPAAGPPPAADTPFEIAHPKRLVGNWSHFSLRASFADSLSLALRADGTLHLTEARFVVGRNGWRPGVTTHDGSWEVRVSHFWGSSLCTRWPTDGRGDVAESCSSLVIPTDSSESLQFGGRYWRRVPALSPGASSAVAARRRTARDTVATHSAARKKPRAR